MKKTLFCLCIALCCSSSVALGFVIGKSNLTLSQYPSFDKYLSYSPSRSEMEMYVQEAHGYVEGCNNDIDRIIEARAEAINKANDAIRRYNNGY